MSQSTQTQVNLAGSDIISSSSISPKTDTDMMFDLNNFNNLLQATEIGKKVVYKNVTKSTMDDARGLAHSVSEYPHGTIVLSERQTNARGARSHTWDASNVGNIYASIILHQTAFSKTFEGRFSLEVAACLACLNVVKHLGVKNAKAKWPNDLWVKGHKVAGFLAEDGKFDIPGTTKCLMILGLGINVNADTRRIHELSTIATSLRCERSGLHVSREKLLADICLALEETLSSSHESNLESFRVQNLFQPNQPNCNISVIDSTECKSFDASFIDICDNWEVKFSEKSSGLELQGRSDKFTVRPRASETVMIAFSGSLENTVAQHLAHWLTSLMDTSRYIVSLVPEASLIASENLRKNCSLLILTSQLSCSDKLKDVVKQFLSTGGRVLAVGLASQFTADLLGVPVEKSLLASSLQHPELGLLQLNPTRTPGSKIVFPTNIVCFHFQELQNKISTSPESSHEGNCHLKKSGDLASCLSVPTVTKALGYCADDEYSQISVLQCKPAQGGCVVLCGFDLGVRYPLKSEHDMSKTNDEEAYTINAQCFERDDYLLNLLDVLTS